MNTKRGAAVVAAFVAATIGLATSRQALAEETPQYTEHYAGTSLIGVTDILSANAYADGSLGFTQAGASIAPVDYAFTDPFLKPSNLFTAHTFFFGVSDDSIIEDPSRQSQQDDGGQHLIVAMELANSQSAIAQDFSDVFTGSFTEGDVLSAIGTLYDGNSTSDQRSAASSVIFDFIGAASSEGALFGTNGNDAAFNLVSFSSGTIVGDGKAFISGGDVSGAPEPSEWALMLGGVGILGGMLRVARARRREEEATASA